MADRKSGDTGLPEQAAQSPQEAAATPNTAPATTGGGESGSGRTVLATTGYDARFVHPDHPDVVLTPKGPVSAETGRRVDLDAAQVKAFRDGAARTRTTLRDIPA